MTGTKYRASLSSEFLGTMMAYYSDLISLCQSVLFL